MSVALVRPVPPVLPLATAPYGTLLCRLPSCRAVMARKHAKGGHPACAMCGSETILHPGSRRPKRTKANAPVVDMRPGDLRILEPCPGLFRRASLLDYWCADNECAHGRLPHQRCLPCDRAASLAPASDIATVAVSERAA